MEFSTQGTTVKLQGERLLKNSGVTNRVVQKMVADDIVASFFHLWVVEELEKEPDKSQQPPEVQELLARYSNLFEKPRQLPPYNEIDYHIHLELGVAPVSVWSYKYPQFQKEEIEKLVEEMLQTRVIWDSHSAFSSLMLLVRKKDGGWQFCVDYRALNAINIKDKLPIPTIDEIINKLFEAEYFSKIDLRSGYHQICLREEDILTSELT